MRIVYDDTQLELLVDMVRGLIIYNFTTAEDVRVVTKYSYGIDRVEVSLVKQRLNRMFEAYGFEISNDVYHENGIGNNNRYPVYYNTPDEKQQVGYLNLIDDMFGGVYVYVTDYNQKKHGRSYELTSHGYTVSR